MTGGPEDRASDRDRAVTPRDDIFIFGTGRLLAKLTGGDTTSQIAKQIWTPLAARLGNTGYDDGFTLSGAQTTFSIAGNGYSVVVEFNNGFPFVQIFAPKDKEFIAIEPMTAATNALCSGEALRVIAPEIGRCAGTGASMAACSERNG